jgi:hypothetical protein
MARCRRRSSQRLAESGSSRSPACPRGNPDVIIPYRRARGQEALPDWQDEWNTKHRQVRAAVEHAFARMKTYKILRDHRRAARTLKSTAAGIALLHNLAIAG